MNDELRMGPDGDRVAHYFEQCRLLAYADPGSPLFKELRRRGLDPYNVPVVPQGLAHLSGRPWTIGWGDTGAGVRPGLRIDQAEADRRYAKRIATEFEPAVRAAVTVQLTQRQFDALVCIFYNVGGEAMIKSTLVRLLNAGNIAGAAAEFPRWNRSGGAVSKGLQRRREAERLLFLGADPQAAIAAGVAKFP